MWRVRPGRLIKGGTLFVSCLKGVCQLFDSKRCPKFNCDS